MPKPRKPDQTKDPRQVEALLTFGKSLRDLLAAREWTPTKFAEKLGTSYDTVVKYQNGKRDPEMYVLVQIAEILEISPDRLIKGKSSARPNLRVVPSKSR